MTNKQTVAQLVPVHRAPRFDLTTEAWIPVTDGHRNDTLGIRAVFENAHRLVGVDSGDALERYALTRYLIALSYRLVALSPTVDWEAVIDGDPIPAAAIDSLIRNIQDQSFLFHPETPFLQEPRLRELVTATSSRRDRTAAVEEVTHPYTVLIPHVPANTNEVWRYETEARGTLGLSLDEAARALVVRYFAATPGNEQQVGTFGKSMKGTLFPTTGTGHRATHVLRHGRTLAATLLLNHVDQITNPLTSDSTFGWETPDPAKLSEPLWQYTCSHAATYLAEPGDDDRIRRTLRGPYPGDPTVWSTAMQVARDRDPHTIRIPVKNGRDGGPTTQKLRVDTGMTPVRFAHYVHRQIEAGAALLPGIATSAALTYGRKGEFMSFTTGSFTGGGGSLRIETVNRFDTDPAAIDLTPAQRRTFVTLADRIAGATKSARTYLGYQTAQVAVGPTAPPSARAAIAERAYALHWDAIDADLADLLKKAAAGATIQSLDTDAWRNRHVQIVLNVFDRIIEPYLASRRAASTAPKARHWLHRTARKAIG